MTNQKQEDKKYRFHVAQDDLFIDLNLYQFGWEHCDSLHQFGPAIRNHFLFHYVIQGKGRLEINGQTYMLKAGQGFLICPGQISSYFADLEDPWFYAWIEFDGLRARQSLTLAGISETQPIYIPKSNSNHRVEEYLLQIVKDAEKPTLYLTGLGMILLNEIAETSKSAVHYEKKKIRDFYMREAINYIQANYNRDISIEEIADSSGLNRSYFSRIFKETFNQSPQKFLLQYRMNKASELLRQTQMSISDIATSVGYENQLHFSRAFKNTYGTSPSNYRNTHLIKT
ncbi:MAG: AraC family transcriptional regulator [Solobacterium sp.]|nr:AraC family transcriptional regulator [Solobacterium sp.]